MLQQLRGLFWACVYVVVAVAPLGVAALGGRPGRSFVIDFSAALGFVGLAVMALQFALVARFQRVSAPFGMDAMLQYHRQIGYVALALVLAHPVLLFVDDPQKLALLDLRTAPWRARFAVTATLLLFLLVASSVWRKRLRLSYERWQFLHGVLAVAVVGLGLAHAVNVGYYLATPWQRVFWVGMTAALLALLGWVRLVRPLFVLRRPWLVTRVHAERGNAWTVTLRPEGHAGIHFEPGQFGWVLFGRSPFALTQHPFSFSSTAEAEGGEVGFTIKARGDFTSSIRDLKPGTRAYVDGPHGLFSIDQDEGPGFVLLAGGVGITPLVSMLRTMVDRDDARPCVLFYANRDWDGVTFRDELAELEKHASLTVVHVLEKPPEGWAGETGYITAAVLRRHLPKRHQRLQYFVCGPPPMMDAMDHVLVELGVPAHRIHTERFDMV
jgi:predicted ferric reductase